jgi:phage-related protein
MSFLSSIGRMFKSIAPKVIKGIKASAPKIVKGVKAGAGKIKKGLKSAAQKLGILKKPISKSPSNIKNIKGSGQFAQIIRGSRPKRGEGFVSGVDSLML